MGINSSFLPQSCTQLTLQLTQKNLLSLDFQKLSGNEALSQNEQIQFYQHCHSKKVYKLQKFQCNRKDAHLLSKALKKLQQIKNNHICNVLFSQVNTKLTNIISKHSQVKIFSEHSSSNLNNFIQKKTKQCIEQQNKQIQSINFTNVQIANFIHSLSGIASEISSLYLPVKIIDPEDFLIMQNQHGKVKYSLRFDQILNQNYIQNLKGYFSPQLLKQQERTQLVFGLNQTLWSEKYEKNFIFSLGMVILHFLLMENCDDCYNYKSGQFCQSQLEKKLLKVSQLLESRLIERQENVQIFKQSRASFSSSGRLSTRSNYFEQQEPFQVILYELIMEMLISDPQQRISVKQLKFRSRKLMQKVHNQVMLKSKSQNSQLISGIFEKAKKQKAMITSPDLPIKEESFQESFLFIKKVSSSNETNNTDSVLPESRGKSIIKQLKSKRKSDKEKSFLNDSISSFISNKENIRTQNIESNVKEVKKGFRKLSGYRKVMLTEHTFIEGFFEDEKAHGLGKITKKNGEIIECIFHNNQIIDAIHPR